MKERRGEFARSVAMVFAGAAMTAVAFSAAANFDSTSAFADGAYDLDQRQFERSTWRSGGLTRSNEADQRIPDRDSRELDEARNTDGDGNDDLGRPGLRRPRGITPPWREHAIPELRNRPDRKSKKFHA